MDLGPSPVDVDPLLSGWSNQARANMHEMCKSPKHVSNGWEQETTPKHLRLGIGALLSLEISVMVSWVARCCRNWEVVSEGALAVPLPYMVGDQQEEAAKIVVGISSDQQLGDVFVVDAGKGSVDLKDFDFEQKVRRKEGAAWGLMPETKEYLARHMMP